MPTRLSSPIDVHLFLILHSSSQIYVFSFFASLTDQWYRSTLALMDEETVPTRHPKYYYEDGTDIIQVSRHITWPETIS